MAIETAHFGGLSVARHGSGQFAGGDGARLVARAEKVRLTAPGTAAADEVSAPGEVEAVDYQGQMVRYFVRVNDLQLQVIATIDDWLID